jgi:SAM-dependent methyltransferase
MLAAQATQRNTCRLCGSTELVPILHLTPTPPANAFVTEAQLSVPQAAFPLDLHFCARCTHVQLLTVVDPQVLFGDYVYLSGTSPVFVAHFERYAKDMARRLKLARNDLAVDIGSNDGTLLGFLQKAGCRVLGIDPARAIAEAATRAGIETLTGFFGRPVAERILREKGQARLVTANNVFAHIDDPDAVLEGIRLVMAPDGLFAFEVSYLVDVYEKTLFDTIYHEHLDYHSLAPLIPYLARNGLEVVDAMRIDTHGGSIRVIAQHQGGPHTVTRAVGDILALEASLTFERPETFVAFGARIDSLRDQTAEMLSFLRKQGHQIAGYGAPAKATTLCHHFGFGRETIDYIVDDSPMKQGLFTPGLHIPVRSPEEIYRDGPDYLLLLAWNFADSIMTRHERYRAQGGHFITPLPALRVD